MGRLITAAELQSRDTVRIARWLLGKVLVRTRRGRSSEFVITEVEAYNGESDLACHASKGRTPRTEVLYSAGGVWYVYFVYGMHHMLNVVTGPADYPAAVLIRGVRAVTGPGRLTKDLGIDLAINRSILHPKTGLHLEDPGTEVDPACVRVTPRIGVDYAGPIWAAKPWRFVLSGDSSATPSPATTGKGRSRPGRPSPKRRTRSER